MITNYKEDILWGAAHMRDDETNEKQVWIVSGVNTNKVCTLNLSRDDWEFNAMLMMWLPDALEIVRRVALDDIDGDDAIQIREQARRINDFLQKEHDKLTDQ